MQEAEVRALYPKAFHYGLRLTGNADDARDLVQMALLKCLQIEEREPIQELFPYLSKVMVNTWISQKRRAALIAFVSIDGMRDGFEPDRLAFLGRKSPEIENCDLRETLMAHVRALPAYMRDAVIEVCIKEQSMEEVARAWGVSINTVKSRLHRARRRLAEQWEGV